MVLGGVWSTLVNLGLFAWALGSGRSLAEAMTMTFVSLVLIQFFKAYNFRSDRHSVLVRPFANRWLNLAIAWELAALALILYVPVLNEPFGTFALPLMDWVIVATAAFTVSPVLELAKWMERRGWFGSLGSVRRRRSTVSRGGMAMSMLDVLAFLIGAALGWGFGALSAYLHSLHRPQGALRAPPARARHRLALSRPRRGPPPRGCGSGPPQKATGSERSAIHSRVARGGLGGAAQLAQSPPGQMSRFLILCPHLRSCALALLPLLLAPAAPAPVRVPDGQPAGERRPTDGS